MEAACIYDTQSILSELCVCVPGFMVYPVVLYKTSDAERQAERKREREVPGLHKPLVRRVHTAGSDPRQDSLQMLHGI